MIILTEKATKAVRRFMRTSEDPINGLRIAVTGGGCSGLQYDLKLKDAPESEDLIWDANGVPIYVDPISATMLTGVQIDFIESLTGSGFKFTNPNASASCACGSSFKV